MHTLDTRDKYRIAFIADVELRTVNRYLSGETAMKSKTLRSIDRALRELGMKDLIRSANRQRAPLSAAAVKDDEAAHNAKVQDRRVEARSRMRPPRPVKKELREA